jgi:hypothetical protein
MKQLNLIFLVVVVIVGLTGCSSTGKLAKELKGDNATVVSRLNTIYGTHNFIRANPTTNQSVTISPDGTVTINSK